MSAPLLILGLDGATFDVIDPMIDAGELPTFARLARDGARGVLRSSPVPVSPCAWTCITTGKNPGRHGVFDFCRRPEGTYRIDVVSERTVRSKRLWDLVGEAGRRSVVFNVPVTWPARAVEGAMLSGLLTPTPEDRFAEPPDIARRLLERVPDYKVSTDVVFDPRHPEIYRDDIRRVQQAHETAAAWLHEEHGADLEFYVFMALDHMQHKLWRRPGDSVGGDASAGEDVRAMYREMDAFLARTLSRYDGVNVMILSDHGFGPLEKVLRLNRWLMQQGFLVLKESPTLAVKKVLARTEAIPKTYRLMQRLGLGGLARFVPKNLQHAAATSGISFDDVDWRRTRAYSYGEFGQIFVNLKGREPEGIVEPGAQYERTLEEIESGLTALRDPDTGRTIVTDVYRKEDLYSGDLLERAPDLTFAIDDYRYDASVAFGFERAEAIGGPEFFDSGSHRPDGILYMTGPAVKAGARIEGADVYDITPTALHLMGLPVPADMDGQVLAAALEGDGAATIAGESSRGESAEEAAPAEGSDVVDRLRALGYMD